MKILAVVPNLDICNGIVSCMLNYYYSVSDLAHMDFAVIHDRPSSVRDELKKEESIIFEIPSLVDPHAKEKCRQFLKMQHYDVIHDNTLARSLPLMEAAKECQVPVRVLHSHNTRFSESKSHAAFTKVLLPRLKSCVNHNFACSQVAGEFLFKGDTFTVIPNIVDTQFTFNEDKRRAMRKQLGILNETLIISVGRMTRQKNPLKALEIVSLYVRFHPDTLYLWIGDDQDDLELRKQFDEKVKALDLENNVRFYGVSHHMNELYNAADLLLMPSLFEGLPVVLVEAQATGLPCVVADTITKEANYSGHIRYLPLASSSQWVVAMEEACNENRYDGQSLFKQSVFSPEGAGKRLIEAYLK